jgi:hypothetical protein
LRATLLAENGWMIGCLKVSPPSTISNFRTL